MSTPATPHIDCEQHHATLSVSDVLAAADFYTKKLGFILAFTEGDPRGAENGFGRKPSIKKKQRSLAQSFQQRAKCFQGLVENFRRRHRQPEIGFASALVAPHQR